MTSEEFRQDLHLYIDDIYDKCQNMKNVFEEIFMEFHRICKKNSITYYAAFGTLLGIKRDNSFIIPWDDDCDVLLPIIQRDALHIALEKDLGNDFFFSSPEKDPNYDLLMLRIGKKGYDLEVFHLDVFYLIGAPKNENEQKMMRESVGKLFRLHNEKMAVKSQKVFALYRGKKYIALTVLKQKIWYYFTDTIRQYDKICKKYSYTSADYYIVIGGGAECFPKTIFEPRQEISINGISCFAPYDPELFLKIRYGNYSAFASINERFREFYYNFLSENAAKSE